MIRLYSGLSNPDPEPPINRDPTVQPFPAPAPSASADRAELLARLLNAQADLEPALAQLHQGGDAALIAQGEAQRDTLAGLQRALATSGPANLTAIRAAITAAISASAGFTQQARGSAVQTEAAELAATRSESRQQVQSLMRDMHRFDPYLSFASPEDEAAYRTREAERRAYIEREHARGTPEGDLNASGAAVGQMVDADAHGAGRSPEFRQRWNELAGTTARLREQVARSGGSTAQFDERLRGELRATLRARGIADSEIDARLAAHPGDPLAAVQDTMRSADDLRAIDRSVSQIGYRESMPTPAAPTIVAVANQPFVAVGMNDIVAELRAAGITAAQQPTDHEFAHGVTGQERPSREPGRG
jgi:hypothetical protein